MNEHLTIKQLAALKKKSRRTVQQWVDKGWLPGAVKEGGAWWIPMDQAMAFQPPKPGRVVKDK